MEVPNALGWRYQFGVALPSECGWHDARIAAKESLAPLLSSYDEAKATLAFHGGWSLIPVGVMLFTFKNGTSLPMRVRVFEASVDLSEFPVGRSVRFDEVPYTEM